MTLSLTANDLHTILSDAMGFVSPASDNLPAIQTVRLESVRDTGTAGPRTSLIAIATDRFTLGASRATATLASDNNIAITIAAGDVKNILRIAKTAKRDIKTRHVAIDNDDNQTTFSFTTGESVTIRPVDTSFPAWRQLLAENDADMHKPCAGIGISAQRLAQFAKVGAAKTDVMQIFPTIKDNGALGVVSIKIGDNFAGLVMAARAETHNYLHQYSRPAWLS